MIPLVLVIRGVANLSPGLLLLGLVTFAPVGGHYAYKGYQGVPQPAKPTEYPTDRTRPPRIPSHTR